ncbi:PREDICTED: thioredoxin domain-containing protein 9 homolog isoform X1 [Nelumbo nucifera]|uniref:Thioredoxin domain-containing protein 9 homolog isoform X1 n=1 Tax=Nelumbo nucifera TaxID=4432 RepID=A0A1U8BJ89_NELNU|nr:PREDICTED: thioredoxin domain-containing protein 9 homolog isoform X1 [Nelumbo nucifera]
MDNPKVQEILEKQVLTVAKAVEDKLDEEISALDRLDLDDLEALRERRLQQMKKMAEKRSRWISLGHGDYSEIPSEKDFFAVVKASERVVCHFYRDNWPCKFMGEDREAGGRRMIITRGQRLGTRTISIIVPQMIILYLYCYKVIIQYSPSKVVAPSNILLCFKMRSSYYIGVQTQRPLVSLKDMTICYASCTSTGL